MANALRKISRNKIRNDYGNKGLKKEWRLQQVYKYGLGNYAKMQHKTQKQVLEERF